MSIPKADVLYQEHKRLYEAINSYNNTLPAQLDAMASGYGIGQVAVSVAHLTVEQKGDLLKTATKFYIAILTEIAGASIYGKLRIAGYKKPVLDAAIVDVAAHFAGSAAVIIQTNFIKTKELFDMALSQFSGYAPPTQSNYTDVGIVALIQKLIVVRNKLVEIAPFMDKVG